MDTLLRRQRCVATARTMRGGRASPDAWRMFDEGRDADSVGEVNGLAAVFPQTNPAFSAPSDIAFDLVANAFCFLTAWSERRRPERIEVAPALCDVDLRAPRDSTGHRGPLSRAPRGGPGLLHDGPGVARDIRWPGDTRFAVALTHDVDFLPSGMLDNVVQGGKSILRHRCTSAIRSTPCARAPASRDRCSPDAIPMGACPTSSRRRRDEASARRSRSLWRGGIPPT